MTTFTLSITDAPTGDFNLYMRAIRRVPRLTKEQEYELAIKYKEYNDISAAQTLILSNLRFVVYIAKTFKKCNIPLSDIVQEGNIGLMKAVSNFDPYAGVRLASYAVYWVKAAIVEYIIKNNNVVKTILSKPHRKVFFNINKYIKEGEQLTADLVNTIATELCVTTRNVYDVIERMSHREVPFDFTDDVSTNFSLAEILTSSDVDPAKIIEQEQELKWQYEILTKALQQLDARSLDIITCRKLIDPPMTFKELGVKYHSTHQNIEQIEKRAMKKIKNFIQNEVNNV
jgi:RNA polymerase sigma-32 factor